MTESLSWLDLSLSLRDPCASKPVERPTCYVMTKADCLGASINHNSRRPAVNSNVEEIMICTKSYSIMLPILSPKQVNIFCWTTKLILLKIYQAPAFVSWLKNLVAKDNDKSVAAINSMHRPTSNMRGVYTYKQRHPNPACPRLSTLIKDYSGNKLRFSSQLIGDFPWHSFIWI